MNTAIGYKLFRISKRYPGKLFPLYVNTNIDVPIGKWVQATSGEKLENGKVKSKLGPLRYRPGFHINDVVPFVSHIGQKVNGKITYMRSDTVWAEVEYQTDIDYCEEARANGITESGRFNYIKADLNHVPENGFYRYKTSPTMTGEWIIAGEMKVLRVLDDQEVKQLCENAGTGYLPRKETINLSEYGFVA